MPDLPQYQDTLSELPPAVVSVGAPDTGANAAARIAVAHEAPLNVEWPEYGAAPANTPAQNSTAIGRALAGIPAAGGDLFFPRPLSYSSPILLTDGMRLMGTGAQQRWRSAKSGTKLTYTGAGQAVGIANSLASPLVESVEIHNIRFDGTGLAGAVDGLFIDGTYGTAAQYVEGVYCFNAGFTNFPRYQALIDGLVIDVQFDRCAFNNVGSPANFDLVHIQQTKGGAGVVTQVTFNDPLFAQYGAAWCCNGAGIDARFFGGTVTTNGGSAGGIYALGALIVMGTHLEGIAKGAGSIGIRWAGANPAILSPSYCAAWAEGIQIGDPVTPANRANGAVINGMVGGNSTDVHIINGGSRVGTIIQSTGQAAGTPPVVLDDRLGIDGAREVLRLDNGGPYIFPGPVSLAGWSSLLSGGGVPGAGVGNNGDFYFRFDGAAGAAIYQKRAGAWVATAA